MRYEGEKCPARPTTEDVQARGKNKVIGWVGLSRQDGGREDIAPRIRHAQKHTWRKEASTYL